MHKRNIVSAIICCMLSFTLTSFANEKIILVADYWCPYNCVPGSENEGFLIEIVREALAKKNIDVDYKIVPWAKAVEDFNNASVDGVIGASPGDVIKPVLPSVAITRSHVSAYTLSSSKWSYDRPESFNSSRLGIVEGYTYSDEIKNYIYSHYIEKPDVFYISTKPNAIEDNITKLLKGEITVYVEDDNVVRDYSKNNNISNLKNSGKVQEPVGLFIAFPSNKTNSVEYARLITDTYFEMKKSGRLKKLADKYGID